MSRLAGMMLPQVAGTLLQNDRGGKGILLSGLAGLPPAEIAILGAGTFGTAAADVFLGLGSSVTVLDQDLARLHILEEHLGHGRQPVLMVAYRIEHPEGRQLRRRAGRRDARPRRQSARGRDARHGGVDEAALA